MKLIRFVLDKIDSFLNGITMYRLVMWHLVCLVVIAALLNFFGFLGYGASWSLWLIVGTFFLLAVGEVVNFLFAKVFHVPANAESFYITALILALTFDPGNPSTVALPFAIMIVVAMASKFLVAINKKHFFNPVAFAMVAMSYAGMSASWWVGGSVWLLPFTIFGGFLIIRKIHRFDLVFAFIGALILSHVGNIILSGGSIMSSLGNLFVHAPVFFFASVMLTEPLTTPPLRKMRIAYGVVTGFLFAPWVHVGGFYFTPELALIAGNIISYILSPKKRLLLTLQRVNDIGTGTKEFIFSPDERIDFQPGQFIEWTLNTKRSDSRGNRRYFTIASSPTEKDFRLGVKFYPNPSAFKESLNTLLIGDSIVASQLAGDFVLPKNETEKMVWIAGGIGVTPFRSMAQYIIDTHKKHDVVMLYANKTVAEISYRDVFDRASTNAGLKVTYAINVEKGENAGPIEYRMIDALMIKEKAPDYLERTFYISGPHMMVAAFKNTLISMGVPSSRIYSDYFPGFA